jgi:phosphate transport system substrate-binding protein
MLKMKKMLALSFCLVCCLVNLVCAEEIKVGGGGASVAAVFNPLKDAFQKASGDQLSVIQSSPAKGMAEMARGNLDIATGAVPLDGMIAGAAKEGVTVDKASLTVIQVATSRTVIMTHPSVKVAKLTKEQLKGIFTGTISNWKDVGGEAGDIIVVWGKNTPGQNAQFIKEILDGTAVAKDALDATDYKSIRENVANTPGSIGIDPFSIADKSVNMPEVPSITSPILAITKGKPSAKAQKLLDFIAGAGKGLIKQ